MDKRNEMNEYLNRKRMSMNECVCGSMADRMPPGFRFHPTDEELVVHYLARRSGTNCGVNVIAQIDLYKYDPWALAFVAEREWYFLTPRDRKYPNGARPNRAAGSGYWKATGTDKPIFHLQSGSVVGIKKALVFYHAKHPLAVKTNYRLPASSHKGPPSPSSVGCLRMDDMVLCRIYKKSSGVANKLHGPSKIKIALDNTPNSMMFLTLSSP